MVSGIRHEHKGYCPYSSVELGVAIKGNPRWTSVYQGKSYIFAMEDAKASFDADPEKYIRMLATLDPTKLPQATLT